MLQVCCRLLLVSLSVFLSFFEAFGQTDTLLVDEEKENFWIFTSKGQLLGHGFFGAGLGFRNSTAQLNTNSTTVNMIFEPSLGVMLLKQWELGITYEYFLSLTNVTYGNNYAIHFSNFALYSRYYTSYGFFGEIQYGRGIGRESYQSDNKSMIVSDLTNQKASFGMGIANYWHKKISYELLFRYNYVQHEANDGSEVFGTSGFLLSAGIGFALGKIY